MRVAGRAYACHMVIEHQQSPSAAPRSISWLRYVVIDGLVEAYGRFLTLAFENLVCN